MGKLYRFGSDRHCPHCHGNGYEKSYTPDEVMEVKTHPVHPTYRIHAMAMEHHKKGPQKLHITKDEPSVAQLTERQATIEQLSHAGWPIPVIAWAVACPDCGTVTGIRAIYAKQFDEQRHGPEVEAHPCEDCSKKGNK